jgi:hypothetical protein
MKSFRETMGMAGSLMGIPLVVSPHVPKDQVYLIKPTSSLLTHKHGVPGAEQERSTAEVMGYTALVAGADYKRIERTLTDEEKETVRVLRERIAEEQAALLQHYVLEAFQARGSGEGTVQVQGRDEA